MENRHIEFEYIINILYGQGCFLRKIENFAERKKRKNFVIQNSFLRKIQIELINYFK